jgi:hypothetical protein
MKTRALWFGGLLVLACLLAGCTEDDRVDDSSGPIRTNDFTRNDAPPTLAGRSYTFSVTANQNFTEPFNSGYTIDFITDTSYILHPSVQENHPTPDRQGNYTYDPISRVIHFAESSPDSSRVFEAILTFTSPTAGTAHLTGRHGETQDTVFYQTTP